MSKLPVFESSPGWKIVLASSSPRRKDMLANLGLEFTILKPDVAEPRAEMGESPEDFAARCAKIKTRACAIELGEKERVVIIGADTIVAFQGEAIGKPRHTVEALEMLRRLSGKSHSVYTAINLCIEGREYARICESKVRFHAWSDEALRAYVASGDPLDKAGAYGIQGMGAFLVESIEGSPSNVAGLPIGMTLEILLQNSCVRPRMQNL